MNLNCSPGNTSICRRGASVKAMKKIICIILAALVLTASSALADGISVIAVSFPPYDFARAIAGDRADISMLLKPGSESHIYEPTPQDIIAIGSCDLFLYGGGESDEWVEGLLEATSGAGRATLAMMDCVELIEEEDEEGVYDEHVWTSPKNAMLIAQAVADALCGVDPDGEAVYRANLERYLGELEELDAAFEEVVRNAQIDTIIFADRFPLIYFAREYGIKYIAAFPGCSTETEPGAGTMARLIRGAVDLKAPLILYLELSNGAVARAVSEQTGADTAVFYACHNLTGEDFEAGRTYVDFMWENVATLARALKSSRPGEAE